MGENALSVRLRSWWLLMQEVVDEQFEAGGAMGAGVTST